MHKLQYTQQSIDLSTQRHTHIYTKSHGALTCVLLYYTSYPSFDRFISIMQTSLTATAATLVSNTHATTSIIMTTAQINVVCIIILDTSQILRALKMTLNYTWRQHPIKQFIMRCYEEPYIYTATHDTVAITDPSLNNIKNQLVYMVWHSSVATAATTI